MSRLKSSLSDNKYKVQISISLTSFDLNNQNIPSHGIIQILPN